MSDSEATGVRQFRFEPPAGATTVLLVRHGESAAARPDESFDLVGGHGDPALHEAGRAQAERVGERLAGRHLDAVYVTTLRRTAETAAPLVARTGVPVSVEPDLREVFLGDWEGGRYRHRVRDGDPIALSVATEERWDLIPGAESGAALTARTVAALERIAGRHLDSTVAVFTHGGVIGAVLAHATRSRPFAFIGADNASVSEIVIHADRWVLRCFNDTAHLADLDLDR